MIEAAERAGLLRPGGTIIEPTSRQHRARPGDRRGAQGLPLHLRDGRQAVGREAGAPAGVRRRGRPVPDQRRPGVAGELLLRGGAARPRHPRRLQAGPVLEPGEPAGPRADDRPRDLGADRRPDHAPGRQRRAPAARSPARPATSRRRTRIRGRSARTRRGASCPATRPGRYLTEGVGEDFFPGTYDPAVVDRWVRVSDRDAFAMARRITREEGILAGESCGTAMVAALDEARGSMRDGAGDGAGRGDRRHPPGRRPQLPLQALQRRVDAGERPARDARRGRPRRRAARGPPPRADLPPVVLARTTERVGRGDRDAPASSAISQMPVSEAARGRRARRASSARSRERGLLDRAYRDPAVVERTVGEVMDRPLPALEVDRQPRRGVRAALRRRAAALLAVRDGRPAGVVTKLDVLEHLAHRPVPRTGRAPGDAMLRRCTTTPTSIDAFAPAPSTPAPSPTS